MDHNDIRHKLSEYIDGSMTGQEKTEIEAHLKTCQQCGDALRELQKTVEHIKSIDEVEPPAWMTQKIMAKVRAETEEKKSLFQRFFFPLSVKLPIQAVAALFLTVTAFYIYRNIQPVPAPSEAPVQEFTVRSEAPPAPALRDEREEPKITRDASIPAKKVPQAPEYKALDMKQEYEKPAPPVALGRAAGSGPAAAKPFAAPEPSRDGKENRSDVISQESRGSAKKQEAPAPAMGLGLRARGEPQMESATSASKAKAAMAEGGGAENAVDLAIKVKEFDAAQKEIEKAVTSSGGRIVRTAPSADKSAITASIKSDRFSELLSKLRTIGDVKEKTPTPVGREGYLTLRITMTKD
jgi:anti-sigma factor RsiW